MSPKRSLSLSETDQPDPKRARLESGDTQTVDIVDEESQAVKVLHPTQHSQARSGLQRSIALVLNHDGYDSATPEAMESFTELVETCQYIILWFLPYP